MAPRFVERVLLCLGSIQIDSGSQHLHIKMLRSYCTIPDLMTRYKPIQHIPSIYTFWPPWPHKATQAASLLIIVQQRSTGMQHWGGT